MSDNVQFINDKVKATAAIAAEGRLEMGSGSGDSGGMDPRIDILERRMAGVEGKLDSLFVAVSHLPTKADLAALPTRDMLRNYGLALGGIVLASMLALLAIFLTASGNMMGAFQTGIAARPSDPPAAAATAPQPIIIQIPGYPPLSPPPAPPRSSP